MHDRELIDAYAEMIKQKIEMGFAPTLLSFMFNALPGGQRQHLEVMNREVIRVYGRFLSRCYRHPRGVPIAELPLWLAFPDWPVYKVFKDYFANIAINDGLHMHAVALTPWFTRLGQDLEGHFLSVQKPYFTADTPLMRIHAGTITRSPEKVVDYVLKSLKTHRSLSDDVLILPRVRSEMPSRDRFGLFFQGRE